MEEKDMIIKKWVVWILILLAALVGTILVLKSWEGWEGSHRYITLETISEGWKKPQDIGADVEVKWTLVKDGIIHKIYEVEVVNKGVLSVTPTDLRVVVSDTSFDISRLKNFRVEMLMNLPRLERVPIWENVMREVWFYDKENCERGHWENRIVETVVGYENRLGWQEEWVELLPSKSKSLTSKKCEQTLTDFSLEQEIIGRVAELKNKFPSLSGFKLPNRAVFPVGSLKFRVSFDVPIVERGTGWGSSGKVAFWIDGVEHHPWWNSDWSYKRKITIDHTRVENENFTDFPVLIEITLDNAKTMDNGDDIAFVNSTEDTQLSHEIEFFDTENLVAWVKIPTLYDNENTVIYMYYGNPSASNQENVEGVWDDNYMMVQHLHETENLADNDHFDSTSNNNDGESYITPEENMDAAGKIDGADNFDGTDDYVRIPTVFATSGVNTTYSLWVYLDSTSRKGPFLKDGVSPSANVGFAFGVGSTTLEDSGNDLIMLFEALEWIDTNVQIGTGWHYITVVIDSAGKPSAYIDGNNVYNYTGGNTMLNPEYYTQIGGYSCFDGCQRYFDGTIDEVRISNLVRSAAWIKTAFNSENDPSSFYEVGSEETMNVAPEIVDVSVDNALVDRKVDNASSGADNDVKITIRVRDNDNWSDISEVRLWIRDNQDVVVTDNVLITDNSVVDENTLDFFYWYDPDNNLDNLGMFDVMVVAYSGEDNDNSGWLPRFVVDDLNVELRLIISGNSLTVSGKVTRVTGLDVELGEAYVVDNVVGTLDAVENSPVDDNFEATYYPTQSGETYGVACANQVLDGVSAAEQYEVVNLLVNNRELSGTWDNADIEVDLMYSDLAPLGDVSAQLWVDNGTDNAVYPRTHVSGNRISFNIDPQDGATLRFRLENIDDNRDDKVVNFSTAEIVLFTENTTASVTVDETEISVFSGEEVNFTGSVTSNSSYLSSSILLVLSKYGSVVDSENYDLSPGGMAYWVMSVTPISTTTYSIEASSSETVIDTVTVTARIYNPPTGGGTPPPPEFEHTGKYLLLVRVRDNEGNYVKAKVRISHLGAMEESIANKTTDDYGKAVFKLPKGTYWVSVFAAGFDPQGASVDVTKVSEVEFVVGGEEEEEEVAGIPVWVPIGIIGLLIGLVIASKAIK